ncbi:MAG: S9 family peptidase [Bacteroidia bacterium]|nr:MAG: S9 family peptidase [Bacteroidia bacterium]
MKDSYTVQATRVTLILLVILSAPMFMVPTLAQKVTFDDYRRAEKFLTPTTSGLVFNDNVRPVWVDNENFWYNSNSRDGNMFIRVNARTGKKSPLFNHALLAEALTEINGHNYIEGYLPLRDIKISDDFGRMEFLLSGKLYSWSITGNKMMKALVTPVYAGDAIVSPDGAIAAFIRDNNLWVRDMTNGEEKALTSDGIENFGYATNNAGWSRSNSPVLKWSPDSKKIATFQHDGRGVGEMYMATTNVGHPELQAWKYPLPGDSLIFRIERVVIDVDARKVVRLNMEPDAHRSTVTDHIAVRGGEFADVEWSNDSKWLGFVSVSRDHKDVIMRIADAETGTVRDILSESEKYFFESGYNSINWRILHDTGVIIWYSRRSDWGHLYLYDLKEGKLRNPVTTGEFNVLGILKVDKDSETIFFMGCGREEGDPYYSYLYSVKFDGSGLKLLTGEVANHNVVLSPDGKYFTDSYSTPVDPPVAIVSDVRGRKRYGLEKTDITDLVEAGWVAPVPFSVKARDGVTELYGLMHKPSNFDPSKKYPIVNYIYPGPQSGSVGSRNFAASRGDRQSIAELGFIVVAIDAMGTPMRSQSFQAAYYGNMGDNGLPDQVSGMKQLADRFPWIDIDRAGIYGHSGGGLASTAAILRYPDFFKVAVSGAGNHDNRNYEDDWGEKWQGLLEPGDDGTTNYDNQANQLQAANLKGKLLLAHGTMDTNVPMYNTLLVVNELIAANKDFDLILFPNRGHGFGNEPYMMRRRWDYFVKHLLGAEPPQGYEIGGGN